MACRTLLRRRSQLALLARACQQQLTGRLKLRRRGALSGGVRLVVLERDGLLLSWTDAPVEETDLRGQPVEVRFEYERTEYVFSAITRSSDKARRLVKLSLPLRVEPARQRRQLRLPLDSFSPIRATFAHVVDNRRQFEALLTDVGDGGIGAVASSGDVPRLHTGDLFWVDMELPDGKNAVVELVVRLVYLRLIKASDQIALGWAFQPADDVSNYEGYLRRLEAMVAHAQENQNSAEHARTGRDSHAADD